MERSQYSYAKIVPNQLHPAASSEKTLFVLDKTYASNSRNPDFQLDLMGIVNIFRF